MTLPQEKNEKKERKLIIFDLDGTLTESKQPLAPDMAFLLEHLREKYHVAVMSGGSYAQFEKQFLSRMEASSKFFEKMILLPTSGAQCYQFDGTTWKEVYAKKFTPEEKQKIQDALDRVLGEGTGAHEKVFGEIIEDREAQITSSALGQDAPIELKEKWDPDQSKRRNIVAKLEPLLPEFSIRIGGTTSIDITKKGIDKAYGIRELESMLHIPISDMLFVGDALAPGGNDYPARASGIECLETSGPDETKKIIEELLQR